MNTCKYVNALNALNAYYNNKVAKTKELVGE